MKLGELKLEEAKALFYAAFGVMLVVAINLALKFSSFTIIIISVFVMFAAYLMDEMDKKYEFMKLIRRKQ